MHTALLVKRLTEGTGEMRLYRLDPPLAHSRWDVDGWSTVLYEFVVVSATSVPYSGPETYIFGANADGDIAEWGELNGSFRGALDHEQALANAGYAATA